MWANGISLQRPTIFSITSGVELTVHRWAKEWVDLGGPRAFPMSQHD